MELGLAETAPRHEGFVQNEQLVHTVRDELAAAGFRVTLSMGERLQRGRDVTYLKPEPSDLVVFATSTADVSAIVGICYKHEIPFMAFGAGTSGEGHVMARLGGVCIDLTGMDKILNVSPVDFECTVQPGVVRKNLNEYLRDTGLWFPIDACPEASIGGMISTRASGTNAVRYGTMRENVVSLEVVLPDGEIIRTGSIARKSAAGYDLTRLFTGAGGTLGIITEATIRIHPIPEHTIAASCCFPTITDAAQAVTDLLSFGHQIGKVEILDADIVRAMNRYSHLSMPERPTLVFDFTGTMGAVAEASEAAREACAANKGEDFALAHDAEERAKLWHARHEAAYAAQAMRPGGSIWATDITVPVSRLAEAIEAAHEDFKSLPFPTSILGHVGDGNFHVLFIIDNEDPKEMELAKEANDRMVRSAIQMGGTCSGEHGLGYAKNHWLAEEFGTGGVRVMKAIKDAIDTKGLLNPGKIFDVGSNY